MSKELVIGSNRHETKVAILEEDQLVEIYFQRANAYSLAGSIHKGRVTRVLPGMQSAFVDLGLERDTFLYVSDFFDENEDIDTIIDDKPKIDDKPNRRYRNDRAERGDRGERPDRRDRGVRSGPEQEPRGEREGESREIRSGVAESTSQTQLAEDETGFQAAELSSGPAPNPEGRENGRPERIDDRPFRGDRRNRRGRRRRQRGPGFPDNKYAQPIAPANAATESGSSGAISEENVIILPGESLAKYRHMPSG